MSVLRVSQMILSAALAACALPTPVEAQADLGSAVDSIQFRSAEVPRRVLPRVTGDPDENGFIVTASADEPRFEFRFAAASTLATNPARRDGGSRDAAHILPTAAISFADATGELGYGVELNSTAEGFAGGEGKDTSILGARVNASLWNRNERLAVFVTYAPKLVYSGILLSRDVTFHDLSLGVGQTFQTGSLSISLDAAVNRRLARSGFRQTQPTASVTLKLPVTGDLSLSLRQQLQRRIFTGAGAGGRRDWNFASLAELTYPIATNVTLRGGVSFERNDSNITDKSFSGFDVGPKAGFGFKF